MLTDNMKYDRTMSYCITEINSFKIQSSPVRDVLWHTAAIPSRLLRRLLSGGKGQKIKANGGVQNEPGAKRLISKHPVNW